VIAAASAPARAFADSGRIQLKMRAWLRKAARPEDLAVIAERPADAKARAKVRR